MHFVREICLRHVKCAAAREGIYFISHRMKWDVSQCTSVHYFTFGNAEYFTKFKSWIFVLWAQKEEPCATALGSSFWLPLSVFDRWHPILTQSAAPTVRLTASLAIEQAQFCACSMMSSRHQAIDDDLSSRAVQISWYRVSCRAMKRISGAWSELQSNSRSRVSPHIEEKRMFWLHPANPHPHPRPLSWSPPRTPRGGVLDTLERDLFYNSINQRLQNNRITADWRIKQNHI